LTSGSTLEINNKQKDKEKKSYVTTIRRLYRNL
jgi:hypothetical protein